MQLCKLPRVSDMFMTYVPPSARQDTQLRGVPEADCAMYSEAVLIHRPRYKGEASTAGKTSGRTDGQTDRRIYRWTNVQMDEWTDGRMYRQMDRLINRPQTTEKRTGSDFECHIWLMPRRCILFCIRVFCQAWVMALQ